MADMGYCTLMRDKKLFILALLISCSYFSILLPMKYVMHEMQILNKIVSSRYVMRYLRKT